MWSHGEVLYRISLFREEGRPCPTLGVEFVHTSRRLSTTQEGNRGVSRSSTHFSVGERRVGLEGSVHGRRRKGRPDREGRGSVGSGRTGVI